MTTIDYYFALNSPWSYMGSARLASIAADNGAQVNVIPVKLGEVFEKTGGLPLPQRSPERKAYRMAELRRWSEFLGIPLVLEPKHFPFDESEGVRLVLAAKKTSGDDAALALATELGRLLWEEDADPADPEQQNRAARRAGLDADSLRAALSTEEADAQWTGNTREAIEKGVFAAPSYVIDGEIFWGQDRLDFVERKLKG
ncbi:MAG: 2-hydroxychromene-2-carboxylate isomerase [Alphaproteobacteria bacterium]|nr:MAG: 2-hydroxychromene-2-carboxylate isomerase [Alphaproteobacteria bacterium]